MRVLHIGKYYPPFAGGIENFLGDLLPALIKTGVRAGALVHDHGGTLDMPALQAIPRRDIRRVPCVGNFLYTPISPRFPCRLHDMINEFKPDLLHLHLPNPSAFWAMPLAAARRLPWVVHWHADVVSSRIDRRLAVAYRFYRPFEQKLLAMSRTILATSPPYLASSKALAPWRGKCKIVPLGLNPLRLPEPTADLTKQARTLWQSAGFKVLAVGRLTYYKGHEFLIRAATDLPDIKILIVGSGERGNMLKELVRSLGLGKKIVILGGRPEPELNALFNTCDCLCLPSVERTEAFGLVLLEAMRYGKPVIAGDINGSGVGWVVDHDKTGLLVRPGDAAALTEALRLLAKNTAIRQQMGRAAAAKFEHSFHIDGIAKKIKEIYDEIM